MHKSVRPFSILPLAASYEDVPLKRNVKSHIRRAENRHAGLEETVEIRFAVGSDVAEAAASVQQLHRDRAAGRVGVVHTDYFGDDRVGRLALDGLTGLGELGDAYVALCEIGGRPVAGRVVLRAGGRSFLSYSGFDTALWRLSSPTLVLSAVIERAIADGDRALNLSLNPDSAKQRWTERVEVHNEFVLVGPARRSRALFSLFWQARSARALRDKRAAVARERAHAD